MSYELLLRGVCCIFASLDAYTPRPSVAKSTWLPSLSPDRHLVYPLTASFAPLKRGAIAAVCSDFASLVAYTFLLLLYEIIYRRNLVLSFILGQLPITFADEMYLP